MIRCRCSGVIGTQEIVGVVLIPSGGQQFLNHPGSSMLGEMTNSPHQFPLAGNGLVGGQMMEHAVFNLFDKVLQILL